MSQTFQILFSNNQYNIRMIKQNNVEQLNQEQIEKHLNSWFQFNKKTKMPMKKQKMESSYQYYLSITSFDDQGGLLLNKISQINKEGIKRQYSSMMQFIFMQIQSSMPQCLQARSLAPIYPIIYRNLNKRVFPNFKFKQILKSESQIKRSNLKYENIKSEEQRMNQINAGLFNQLIGRMTQLIQQTIKFYGQQYAKDLEEVISSTMLTYSQQNINSNLIKCDQSSLVSQQNGILQDFGQKLNKFAQMAKKTVYKKATKTLNHIGEGLTNVVYGILNLNSIKKVQSNQKQEEIQDQRVNQIISSHIKTVKEIKYIRQDERQFINQVFKSELQNMIENMIILESHQILSKIIQQILYEDCCQFLPLKQQVFNEFMYLVERCVKQTEKQNKESQLMKNYTQNYWSENEQGVICMIAIYKLVQKNYDSYRRRILKSIFKKLQVQLSLTINSMEVLKEIQKISLPNNISELQSLFVNQNKSGTQNSVSGKDLEIQLKRIQVKQFNRQHKINKLQLVRLSKKGVRSKVINFMISGFLSEDTNKLQEWQPLVEEMEGYQIYGIIWASKSVNDMLKFAIEGVKDILSVGVGKMVGGPYLRAAAIVKQIYEKYHQNPFNPALAQAEITGYFLGQLIISSFNGSLVNLIGFSLGTQVISATLKRLSQRNYLHLVNKTVFMGGAADYRQIMKILQNASYPLDIVNLNSQNDSVLKYLLRVTNVFSKPIGLYDVIFDDSENQDHHKSALNHNIKNQDCSDFISGHLKYRKYMKFVAGIIDIRNDI